MYQDNLDYDIYQDDMYASPEIENNWSPNLFAKLAKCIQASLSPDVIRMGIIAGIRNSSSQELDSTNWEKVEAMRHYIDSVNRGLGLPEDSALNSILQSAQWKGYGIYTMDYISEKNLDFQGICQEEQTTLSYPSMAFLIALVKGMSMLNLHSPKKDEAMDHIFTILIPSQFSSFSFASFLNVANTRLSGKDNISSDDMEALTNLAFKNRYWKQGASLKGKDSELFVFVLKNILSDILGITLDIDTDSFSQQARKEELIAITPKEITLTSKELDTQNISIAKAIEIVLTKFATPLTKETILSEILQLRPNTKEASFTSMINMLHRQEAINYYEGGLIGIKGKRYGRGYKTTKRLQRAVKAE